MAQSKLIGIISTNGFGHKYAAYSIIYGALEESGVEKALIVNADGVITLLERRDEAAVDEGSTRLWFSVEGNEEQLAQFRKTYGLGNCYLTSIN